MGLAAPVCNSLHYLLLAGIAWTPRVFGIEQSMERLFLPPVSLLFISPTQPSNFCSLWNRFKVELQCIVHVSLHTLPPQWERWRVRHWVAVMWQPASGQILLKMELGIALLEAPVSPQPCSSMVLFHPCLNPWVCTRVSFLRFFACSLVGSVVWHKYRYCYPQPITSFSHLPYS